jgi:hypothetical protein
VRAARIVFPDGKKIEMRATADFVGDLTVSGETSYYIELVSVDGERIAAGTNTTSRARGSAADGFI